MTTPNQSPRSVDVGPTLTGGRQRRARLAVVLGLTALIAFVVLCAVLGDVGRNVPAFQIAYAVALAGFALLVRVVLRPDSPELMGRWGWWLIACLILRLPLLHVTPSDDAYRYLWEGRIQGQGFNPFALSPDSPRLRHLRDGDWSQINHPDYPTIYPPLAQAVFLLAALLRPSIFAVKVCCVVFDIAAVALLARWAAARGHPPHRALIYGLCPLTLTAFAIDGHVDSLMLLCLVGAGLLFGRQRLYWGAVLLAGAIAAKIAAVVLVGWLVVRSWRAALLCLGCVAAMYLPYVSAGSGLYESLTRFVGTTDFFGLLHPLLSSLVGGTAARAVSASLLLAVASRSVRRGEIGRAKV